MKCVHRPKGEKPLFILVYLLLPTSISVEDMRCVHLLFVSAYLAGRYCLKTQAHTRAHSRTLAHTHILLRVNIFLSCQATAHGPFFSVNLVKSHDTTREEATRKDKHS